QVGFRSDAHARYDVAPVRMHENAEGADAECIRCPRGQPVIRDRLADAGQGEGCPCSRYSGIHHRILQLVSASLRYRLDHHKQLTGYTLVNSDDLRLLQWLSCRLFASSRSKTGGEEF